ncbi:MAG: ATP-grasp domain-containing protein [Candidatus Hadarchaeales archaeon]
MGDGLLEGIMMSVGVLGISYGSRFVCIAESLCRSSQKVRLFIADKQRNPYNLRMAEETGGEHVVIPDLNIREIVKFANRHSREISFGVLGPEGPGMNGVRDAVERETGIPMICPTRRCFIERSKVEQRELIERIAPKANPRFRVFYPEEYKGGEVKEAVWRWLDRIGDAVAVKPDAPAAGKGVGVWGDHFSTREEMFERYFMPNFKAGPVIVEEKLEGEEFSLQLLSDGKHLVPTPAVRDYKRAFDWDQGQNTGGMGSYKDGGNLLPFMSERDWNEAIEIAERVHEALKGGESNPEVRGVLYMAYILTSDGVKVLEVNSRWGDPEVMNVLPLMKDDPVEVCFRMLDGGLRKLEFEELASVLVYAVPLDYGGYAAYSGPRRIDISQAEALREKYGERMRIYPGAVEVRDGELFALKSRAVGVLGISETLEGAREIAMEGIRRIDGPLRHREDIALREHVERSVERMRRLRKCS